MRAGQAGTALGLGPAWSLQ